MSAKEPQFGQRPGRINAACLLFVLSVFGAFYGGLAISNTVGVHFAFVFPLALSLLGGLFLKKLIQQESAPPTEQQSSSLRREPVVPTEEVGQNDVARLIEGIPDGLAETDCDGKIRFINRAMASLLGMNSSEPSAKMTMQSLLAAQSESSSLQDLFAEGSLLFPKEVEIERKQGDGTRILRIARHPIGIRDNNPVSQAWSVMDVTQFRQADKARNSFFDTATHELRTPLANIKAYAETLATSEFDDVEEQKKYCNVINNEASRLARFIDEILDISSIEAGALSANKQETDVTGMLEEIAAAVEFQMLQKNIQMQVSIAENIPNLNLDKEKFSTCLMNLLGNAAKYTPTDGEVFLSASVRNDSLVVEVADTGYGISKEELPRIFDKFFRSDDERVHQEVGSGLGLSYTQEVVRLHGGSIHVESELNHGSRFTILLPLPGNELS